VDWNNRLIFVPDSKTPEGRNSGQTLWEKKGSLGVSFKAYCVRASQVDLQLVSPGAN